MRILMLTQWFEPEPFFKGLQFARELARRSHRVEILTGFPNYPGGKLFPGYRLRAVQREVIEGIPVLRVPLYPSHDSSSFKRVTNYVSFALSAAFLGGALVKPADVMYVYHPPATVGLAAFAISRLRGIPFIYDIQDLWPDTLAATGMMPNRAVLAVVGRWCRFVYRKAAGIVVLSPGFRDKLIERGVPADKIEVIYNWSDQVRINTEMGPVDRNLFPAGCFHVVFAGTMGKAQALDSVLAAALLLLNRRPLVRFTFIGGGVEADSLSRKAAQLGLANVQFLPRRSPSEMGTVFLAADALLVHLRDDPLFAITVPSKTQSYLAAGRPIIMAVRGDAADLVRRAGAGVTCNPQSPESLAAAIEELIQLPADERSHIGERGRTFYERELSLRVGVDRFERLFLKSVEKHKG